MIDFGNGKKRLCNASRGDEGHGEQLNSVNTNSVYEERLQSALEVQLIIESTFLAKLATCTACVYTQCYQEHDPTAKPI